MARSIIARVKKSPETDSGFTLSKFEEALERGHLLLQRESGERTKTSFAPSNIGYRGGPGVCFSGDTEFVTDRGIRTLRDAVGESVVVWTGGFEWGSSKEGSGWSKSNGWKKATVESFGVHPLMKLTVERDGIQKEIFTTAEHRWIVETSKYEYSASRRFPKVRLTSELEPGWRLWRAESAGNLTKTGLSVDGRRWKVVSVEETGRTEEVFCVIEPVTHRFSLADGILTMNCQRYWHYAFSGTHFDESVDSVSIAMMSNGRVSHERIQEAMEKAGIVVEIEKEMLYEDPPIKGYADAILEIDGDRVVCEIKTCSAQAFQYRLSTGKPAIYHLYQILIYMMIEGLDKGVLLYEDRDSLRVCPILVRKTDQSDKILNDALDWMRAVYSDWKDGKSLTTRIGKTKRSPICKNCPVFDTCWSPFEPVGDRESLPFPEVKL